jgi:hypothetical protein
MRSISPDAVPPGACDERTRAVLCAELDALVALEVFNLSRGELSQILDTFPIVRRRDEERFGGFQTRDLIISAFDRATQSRQTTSSVIPSVRGEF